MKAINTNWLEKVASDTYNSYLMSAFKALISSQNHNLIEVDIDNDYEPEDKNINNNYILTAEEENQQYPITKLGKHFKALVQREVSLKGDNFYQIEGPNKHKKIQTPDNYIIEKKNQKNQDYFFKFPDSCCRIILQYKSSMNQADQSNDTRHCYIYLKNLELANKIINKLKYQKCLEKFDNSKEKMIFLLKQRFIHGITSQFQKLLKKSSGLIKNSTHDEQNLQILNKIISNYDQKNIKIFTDIWKQKALAHFKNKQFKTAEEIKIDKALKLQEKDLFQKFDKTNISTFLQSWKTNAQLQEISYETSNSSINLKFKSIILNKKSFLFLKPMLEISFKAVQTSSEENNQRQQNTRKINSKDIDLNNLSTGEKNIYFTQLYTAQLKLQIDENHFEWELLEYYPDLTQAESYLARSIENQGISFFLHDVGDDDIINIKFYDGLQQFKSQANKKKAADQDQVTTYIFVNNIKKIAKLNTSFLLKFAPYLRIDILFENNIFKPHLQTHTFLKYIQYLINNSDNFVDPFYPNIINKIVLTPKILYNVVNLITEKNQFISDQLRVFSGYIVRHYKENSSVISDLQFILYNQLNFNLSTTLLDLEYQIQHLTQIENTSMIQVTTLQNGDLYSFFCQFLRQFQQFSQQTKELSSQLENIFIRGLPFYCRQAIWYNILQTNLLVEAKYQNQIQQSQQIPQNSGPEIKDQHPVAVYNKILILSKQLNNDFLDDCLELVAQFISIDNTKQKIINDNEQHKQIINIFCVSLIHSDVINSQTKNIILSYSVYQLAVKLISMTYFNALTTFENQNYRYTVQKSDTPLVFNYEQESFSFWMMQQFLQKIACKSLMTHQMSFIQEELLEFEIIFRDLLPDVFSYLASVQIDVKAEFAQHFLNLFSNLFPSEYLYRIWDFLVYECYNNQNKLNQKNLRFAIALALVDRCKQKLTDSQDSNEFQIFIQVTASFISPTKTFIEETSIMLKKIDKIFVEKNHFFYTVPNNAKEYDFQKIFQNYYEFLKIETYKQQQFCVDDSQEQLTKRHLNIRPIYVKNLQNSISKDIQSKAENSVQTQLQMKLDNNSSYQINNQSSQQMNQSQKNQKESKQFEILNSYHSQQFQTPFKTEEEKQNQSNVQQKNSKLSKSNIHNEEDKSSQGNQNNTPSNRNRKNSDKQSESQKKDRSKEIFVNILSVQESNKIGQSQVLERIYEIEKKSNVNKSNQKHQEEISSHNQDDEHQQQDAKQSFNKIRLQQQSNEMLNDKKSEKQNIQSNAQKKLAQKIQQNSDQDSDQPSEIHSFNDN